MSESIESRIKISDVDELKRRTTASEALCRRVVSASMRLRSC